MNIRVMVHFDLVVDDEDQAEEACNDIDSTLRAYPEREERFLGIRVEHARPLTDEEFEEAGYGE